MVLLKQKDFAISKSRVPGVGCTSVPILHVSLWDFFGCLFGLFINFEAYYPIAKQYKEMLTVKEVIKRGSQ